MIINCDNCERDFEPANVQTLPVDGRPLKVPCPYCGDVNRVEPSEHPGAETSSGGRAYADKPQASSPTTSSEKILAVIRPAMFRAHPWRWLLIVGGGVGGLVVTGWAMYDQSLARWLIAAGLIVFGIFAAWFAYWWVGTHWWMRLEVTNKRTVRYEGIIKRHSTEVLHDHVRSVDIRQSLLERMFNVGDVGIDSAGQDGIEIEVSDIPAPYRVKELIDQHRRM